MGCAPCCCPRLVGMQVSHRLIGNHEERIPGTVQSSEPAEIAPLSFSHWLASSDVCMVITYSRVWINRIRLPILLVVS